MSNPLFFTENCQTSDFRVAGSQRLVLNLDNGPEGSGHRRQFLGRMVAFAEREELAVRLLYYPPYHRKYHGIERY